MNLMIDFLFTTGIVINSLILFNLLLSKKRGLPNRILISIFVALLFVLLNAYSQLYDLEIFYNLSFLVADAIGYLLGPLLLIYIKSLHQTEEQLIKKHLLHFIPFIFYFLAIVIPFFICQWTATTLCAYQTFIEQYDFVLQLQALYLIVYCLVSLSLLGKVQKSLKLNYSNLQQKDLNWIKYLLIGLIATIVVNLMTVIYENSFGFQAWDTAYITTGVLIVLILYLWYYGSNQSRIFIPNHLLVDASTQGNASGSTAKSHHLMNASEQEVLALEERLSEVLAQDKPYLDPELTLDALAKLIPISDKKLSALLNHHMKISFYSLINKHRVEEVKQQINSEAVEQYTLLGLAYAAGFNSKASFNRIFKKEVGLSPSQYKKEVRGER